MSLRDLVAKTIPLTPSDTAKFAIGAGLTVDVAGNVAVIYQDQSTDTLYLAAGIAHPYRVIAVKATGTTATGIHLILTNY